MAKIIFENTNDEIELPDNSSLKEVCEEQGVPMACDEGICGACVIDVVEGMENLNEMTDQEKDFFGDLGTERLACQCTIKTGTVKVKY